MLSYSLDKTRPAPGDKVTLTVTSDKRQLPVTFPVLAGSDVPVNVAFVVQGPVTAGAGAPVLTPVSDDGKVAVFTFIAPALV
jgi:hypothetical protein